MSLALVYSRALSGMNAPLVEVEAHLANGLPHFNIVGLPDTEVKESRDRVRAAIIQSGFDFPAKKITVNLAPADLPKESGRFDLPIALGILAASGQINPEKLSQYEFAGELALSGLLRPRNMSLPENWRCPACCVPYAARWPWHGRECRQAVRSSCRKKMPNRLPSCAVSRFMVRVL